MAPDPTPSSAFKRLLAASDRFLQALHRPARILVAFSGGGDSTGLLLALSALLKSPAFEGISLHAATVDHGLRPESGQEAERAGAFTRSRGVPHSILRWQPPANLSGMQARARGARYRLLAEEAHRISATVIVTGHNADDQAETIAMRRVRGEGEGLAGMAPAVLVHRRTWALRPLLGLSRADIRCALQGEGIQWSEDPSNDNLRFERIRMRNRLGEEADPPHGHSFAQRLDAARQQAGWLGRCVTMRHPAVADVSRASLHTLDDSNAARALFKLSAAIGGKAHIAPEESRSRMLTFLAAGNPGRMTLGGTVFDLRSAGLWLYRENRNLLPVTIQPGRESAWDGRYRVSNQGLSPLTIAAGSTPECVREMVDAGVLEAVARRAAPAMPVVAANASAQQARVQRQIAAHAEFLPAFELPLADWFLESGLGMPVPPLPVSMAFFGKASSADS